MVANFCSGQFWDLNQTWYSNDPDFSECFQDIVLTTCPCFLYCIFLVINLCLLRKPISHNVLPWTWLNISKLCFAVSLLIMSVTCCALSIHDKVSGVFVPHSSLMSSGAKVAVFFLIVITMLRHRSCGVTTSITLSTFWLLFSFCSIILYRSVILKYFVLNKYPASEWVFLISMNFYPIIFLELVLSAFTDRRKFNLLQTSIVMNDVSFMSYVSFLFFVKIIYKGWKRLLVVSDLTYETVHLTASACYVSFEKQFKHYLLPNPDKDLSIVWALVKAFWPWIVGTLLLDLVDIVALMIPPLLIDPIIEFATDDFYVWRGYFFASLMFLADFTGKLIRNVTLNYMAVSGIQFQTAALGAIFRKNLHMSTEARKEYPAGSIMSLVTVDIKRILWFTMQFSSLLTAPIKIAVIIYILWRYIGISSMAGVVVMFILFPLSVFVLRFSWKYSDLQMAVKEKRIKMMNEILNGIKILKLYAWEVPFANRVADAREEEIKWIRWSLGCYLAMTFIYFLAPFAVAFASFTTYLMVDKAHVLHPKQIFVTLTLMEQLRYALFDLPDAVADLVQYMISLTRIKNYLVVENKDSTAVGDNPDHGESITIRDASYSWTAEADPTISNINLHVPTGKLVAIIGPVGAGKSSLLSSLLGELSKRKGSVDMKGTVAYVPQQPWVLNRSLKENILLTRHMVEEKYNKILNLCCLRPDLEILPAGDATEIGEKGVNLSGGQKLRINLAQAVYQDKDIYLLDDPLSAVDVHVRKALFKNIIGNTGLLGKKTRILVTHDVSVLPDVDMIVSLKDGKIEEMGSYNDLISNRGSFRSFVDDHSNTKMAEENVAVVEKSLDRLLSKDSNVSKVSGGGDADLKSEKYLEDSEENDDYRLIASERMEIGGVHRNIYWNYIKKNGVTVVIAAAFWYLVFNSFEAGGNIWLSKWSAEIDHDKNETSATVSWRLSIYGGFGIIQVVAAALGGILLLVGSSTASIRYHKEMLESVMKSPMQFFDTTPLGRILNRFTTDMDIIDNQLFYRTEGWMNCLFSVLISFVIIGMNTPVFFASIIPIVLLYYMFQRFHLNTFRQIKRLESTTRSPVYSLFMETIQGVSSVSAYGVEKEFIQSFEERMDKCFVCLYNSFVCNRWLGFCLDSIGSFIILLATLLAIYNRENLNPAVVGLIMTYALSITDSLKWLVRMNSELEDKSISIERIVEYCHLKPEAPWNLEHKDMHDDWPEEGTILFDNYSTRYRENLDLVLKELNVAFNSAEKVGIIGRTGAGKSSITLALFRIIEPVAGTICIDNIDIMRIGLHNLRSKLTIIPQDPVLFNGSLRMNLDPNNEYCDEKIWAALEQSHLKSFVTNLNEALEYNIEENGSNLSAGQRQLVCLARALLKNSKILVMDEATASVDMDTDRLIQNTIRTAFGDRTVITIAHRLHTVLDYDKIVIMENGNIVEVGNPSQLLKDTSSRFYELNKEAGLI